MTSRATPPISAAPTAPSTRAGFRFVTWAFLGVLLAAVVGFWPPYFSRLTAGLDVYTHAHAALMLLWCLLLVTQAGLVRARQVARHRVLGRLAWPLGPAVAASIVLLAHHRLRVTFNLGQVVLLYVQLGTLVLFVAFWLAGLLTRARPAWHARFMIAGAFTLLDPIAARLVAFYAPGAALLSEHFVPLIALPALLGLAWCDRARPGRERLVFPAAAALFALYQVGLTWLAPGTWWARVAAAFLALPLT